MVNIVYDNLPAMLLVFVRMAGMILFNPIFSRRNIPNQFKIALVLVLTFLITPTVSAAHIAAMNDMDIILAFIKELFVGVACAYVFNIFYYLLFFVGDVLDVGFGLSMAKVFDPGTNIQMSVTGNFFNLIFIFYIFATDSHLLMIRLFTSSYEIIPVGAVGIQWNIWNFAADMFIYAFSLVARLAFPFIAAVLVMEMAMGVLMKLIPQIHVFVINIQMKLLLGLVLLLAFASPITGFIDNYMNIMFENMQNVLYAISGG